MVGKILKDYLENRLDLRKNWCILVFNIILFV